MIVSTTAQPRGVSSDGGAYQGSSPLSDRYGPYSTAALSPGQFGLFAGSYGQAGYDGGGYASGAGVTGADVATQ